MQLDLSVKLKEELTVFNSLLYLFVYVYDINAKITVIEGNILILAFYIFLWNHHHTINLKIKLIIDLIKHYIVLFVF